MMNAANGDDWSPGPIGPKPVRQTVPVSVRVPKELYEELGRYARRVSSPRSYLIVECIRRLLASSALENGKSRKRLPAAAGRRG